MKTKLSLLFCLPLLALAAANRYGASTTAPGNPAAPAQSCRMGDGAACPATLATAATPTTAQPADLVFAVEEERVAHDLYLAASERWSLPVFAHILQAETRHATGLEQLAASAAIVIPSAARGHYATVELQKLHDDLLAIVNSSEIGALKAGALVEETDIADLRRLKAKVTDAATLGVIAHLETASLRHLSAFVTNLAARGVTYQPQVLGAAEVSALPACGNGNGNGWCNGNGNGGKGRGYGRGAGNGWVNGGACPRS